MNSFGHRIKELLDLRGMSQTKIALQLGLGKQAVSDWVNGKSHPTANILTQLSEILDVSLDYLLDTKYAERHLDYHQEITAKDPQTEYNSLSKIERLECEVQKLNEMKEILLKHNEDQELIITLLKKKVKI